MSWRRLNILVLYVEDDPAERLLVTRLLRGSHSFNIAIQETASVERAIECLTGPNHKDFDVILTDLSLPDASADITVAMLAKEAGNIPIIVLSGASDPVLVQTCLKKGASGFLHKHSNMSAENLDNAILSAMHNRRASTPPTVPPLIPHDSKRAVALITAVASTIQMLIWAIVKYLT